MAQKTILVVEDEPNIASWIEARLETEGYKADIVPDGQAALDYLQTHTPNLILLDIMLPLKDGIEVCETVKKDPKTKDIPIIMLTTLKESDHIQRSAKAGAEDYVCKPVEFEYLLKKIRQWEA